MDRKSEDFAGCSHDVLNRNELSGSTTFCSQDNWQSSVMILAQELELLGYPSPCSNQEGFEERLDVVSLVNTAWSMLQSYKSCLKVISDMEDRLKRVSSDIDDLRLSKARQKELIESKERQISEVVERERQVTKQVKDEQDVAKNAKEQVRRLQMLINERELRFGHEIKRKDQEVVKLKDRLLKLLADKTQIPSGCIEMTALMSKPDGRRGRWQTEESDQKREDDLVQRIIQDYKEKQEALISENSDLRENFYHFQYEISRLLHGRPCTKSSLLPLDITREKVNKVCHQLIEEASIVLESRTDDQMALQNNCESSLEAQKTELNKIKEQMILESVRLSACVPMSNVSNVDTPAWTFGKTSCTLPPSGKVVVGWPPRQLGAVEKGSSRRSSLSGRPRSKSREVTTSPRSSPVPQQQPRHPVTLREIKSRKQRPRSANFSPSPHRLLGTPSRRFVTSPPVSDHESNHRQRTGSLSPSSVNRFDHTISISSC